MEFIYGPFEWDIVQIYLLRQKPVKMDFYSAPSDSVFWFYFTLFSRKCEKEPFYSGMFFKCKNFIDPME